MESIVIYGEKFHVATNMGTFVEYKRLTGKEVGEGETDLTGQLKFLYSQVKSTCLAEGREFKMDFEQFASGINLDDFNDYLKSIPKQSVPETKKKDSIRSRI